MQDDSLTFFPPFPPLFPLFFSGLGYRWALFPLSLFLFLLPLLFFPFPVYPGSILV